MSTNLMLRLQLAFAKWSGISSTKARNNLAKWKLLYHEKHFQYKWISCNGEKADRSFPGVRSAFSMVLCSLYERLFISLVHIG